MYTLNDLNQRISVASDLFKDYLNVYRSSADAGLDPVDLVCSFNRLIFAVNECVDLLDPVIHDCSNFLNRR